MHTRYTIMTRIPSISAFLSFSPLPSPIAHSLSCQGAFDPATVLAWNLSLQSSPSGSLCPSPAPVLSNYRQCSLTLPNSYTQFMLQTFSCPFSSPKSCTAQVSDARAPNPAPEGKGTTTSAPLGTVPLGAHPSGRQDSAGPGRGGSGRSRLAGATCQQLPGSRPWGQRVWPGENKAEVRGDCQTGDAKTMAIKETWKWTAPQSCLRVRMSRDGRRLAQQTPKPPNPNPAAAQRKTPARQPVSG